MRIFFCGILLAIAVACFIIVVFPDMTSELSDLVIMTAFICAALSQTIKQIKEKGGGDETNRKDK